MNIRRLQGAALIISAVIDLIGLIGSGTPAVRVLFIIGGLLLIFGIPAIQSVQPAGTLQWIGIILIELAAVIALVLNVMSMSGGANFGETIPLISAVAGLLGRLIVGWLTTQRDEFMKWVGWAFMADGVLNFIGDLITNSPLAFGIGVLGALAGAAALLGYGWGIMQRAGGWVSHP